MPVLLNPIQPIAGMSIITLTTDFGSGSPYAAAMKGVILSIHPAATIVDITHDVPPQNIRAAAIVLDDVCELFPEDTIHVVVVDPGVGTSRALIYARIGRQQYVAPDNGVLSCLAERTAPAQVVRIENRAYWLPEVSNTFHGRDILAPVAARLSLGLDANLLGTPVRTVLSLARSEARQGESRIDGIVQAVDSFGNLITNITAAMLLGRPTDRRACVVCSIFETWGIFSAYGQQPEGTLVALIDSRGRLELALVGDNASSRLGVQVGTPVTVAWDL